MNKDPWKSFDERNKKETPHPESSKTGTKKDTDNIDVITEILDHARTSSQKKRDILLNEVFKNRSSNLSIRSFNGNIHSENSKKLTKELININKKEINKIRSWFFDLEDDVSVWSEGESSTTDVLKTFLIWILCPFMVFLLGASESSAFLVFISIFAGFVGIFKFLNVVAIVNDQKRKEAERDIKIKENIRKTVSKLVLENKKEERIKKTTQDLINQLDEDGNGIVDVIEENDFKVLLNKYQEKIKATDKKYLQKFVKVSSWLETKKSNVQKIFDSIKNVKGVPEVLMVDSLKAEIHVYEQVLFNALNMISALIEDDMLTFYEIEDVFDDLNMFDSKLEKDISKKLSDIGDGLSDVRDGLNAFVNEMNQSTNRIIESVQTLTYVTAKTNERLEGHLKSINSSIKVGNLVNSINTYQNWRQKKLSDVKSQ